VRDVLLGASPLTPPTWAFTIHSTSSVNYFLILIYKHERLDIWSERLLNATSWDNHYSWSINSKFLFLLVINHILLEIIVISVTCNVHIYYPNFNFRVFKASTIIFVFWECFLDIWVEHVSIVWSWSGTDFWSYWRPAWSSYFQYLY
jgi:hypothetical protein